MRVRAIFFSVAFATLLVGLSAAASELKKREPRPPTDAAQASILNLECAGATFNIPSRRDYVALGLYPGFASADMPAAPETGRLCAQSARTLRAIVLSGHGYHGTQ